MSRRPEGGGGKPAGWFVGDAGRSECFGGGTDEAALEDAGADAGASAERSVGSGEERSRVGIGRSGIEEGVLLIRLTFVVP